MVFGWLVAGLLAGPEKANAQTNELSPVLGAERTRFDALVASDTAAVRAVLHPDLLYIHSNGLEESADDFVASVASAKIVYQAFEPVHPPRVRIFRKTALVDGTLNVQGLYQGTAFAIQLRYTSVYRRVRGQWRLIRWQSLKR